MNIFIKHLIVIGLFIFSLQSVAQSDSTRFKLIHSLSEYINRYYVSADIARKMTDTINWKLNNNQYNASLNPDEFAFELTKDLRQVSHDRHISVTPPQRRFISDSVYAAAFNNITQKQRKKEIETAQRLYNESKKEYKELSEDGFFNFGDIKILPGNIGYIEIKDFNVYSGNKKEGKKISFGEALEFLRSTDDVIIDLRDNQGGFLEKAVTFCSFFSPQKDNYFSTLEVHFRNQVNGVEKESAVLDTLLTSSKYDNQLTRNKNVYVLVSRRTFSAAETAAYKVKCYNPSATIVGEKTEGGGNSFTWPKNDQYYTAIIPNSKVYDEQNANFSLEGKGMQPDVYTEADSALFVAYRLALSKDKITADSETKYLKKAKEVKAENELNFKKFYPGYPGDYRKVTVTDENNELYMVYDSYHKLRLLPTAIDHFTTSGSDDIKFIRNNKGMVSQIQIKHNDEFSETFTKQ